jgi:predicted metal-dependent hydrolase
MIFDMVISMMTEEEFWDKFNKKHNPRYYYAKKKTKEEKTKNKKKGCDDYSARRHSLYKSKS